MADYSGLNSSDVRREADLHGLFLEYVPFMRWASNRYAVANPILRQDDLFQDAALELVKAYDRYFHSNTKDEFSAVFKQCVVNCYRSAFKNEFRPKRAGKIIFVDLQDVAEVIPAVDTFNYFIREGLEHLYKMLSPTTRRVLGVYFDVPCELIEMAKLRMAKREHLARRGVPGFRVIRTVKVTQAAVAKYLGITPAAVQQHVACAQRIWKQWENQDLLS